MAASISLLTIIWLPLASLHETAHPSPSQITGGPSLLLLVPTFSSGPLPDQMLSFFSPADARPPTRNSECRRRFLYQLGLTEMLLTFFSAPLLTRMVGWLPMLPSLYHTSALSIFRSSKLSSDNCYGTDTVPLSTQYFIAAFAFHPFRVQQTWSTPGSPVTVTHSSRPKHVPPTHSIAEAVRSTGADARLQTTFSGPLPNQPADDDSEMTGPVLPLKVKLPTPLKLKPLWIVSSPLSIILSSLLRTEDEVGWEGTTGRSC